MAIILRVRATLTYGSGGPGVHTSYWAPGTLGGITADATDVVARVRAMFASAQAQYPNSTVVVVQTDVAQLQDSTGILTGGLSAAAVGTVTGTGGAVVGPLAGMALVRLRTGAVVNGRIVRGRWYMGPLGTGAQSASGGIAAGSQTAFNTAAGLLLAAGPTTSQLVVWHRPTTTTIGSSANVTSVSTWDQMAVLRSRRDP